MSVRLAEKYAPVLESVRPLARRARATRRDVTNVVSHGLSAPRAHELQYVRLASMRSALTNGVPQGRSGSIVGGDWDRDVQPLTSVPHIRQCLDHWGDGRTWAEVGAIDLALDLIEAGGGMHGGMRNSDDADRRYASVDRLHETVRAEGRLSTRREIERRGLREYGGILVHFDRDARPVFNGWQGCHRVAVAIQCNLEWIPVQVGMVHRAAVRTWRESVRRNLPSK